jgi:hypothetical protein
MLREAQTLVRSRGEITQSSSELVTLEAADFTTGGVANFARAADRRGMVLATWRTESGEPREQFLPRVRNEAQAREAIGL